MDQTLKWYKLVKIQLQWHYSNLHQLRIQPCVVFGPFILGIFPFTFAVSVPSVMEDRHMAPLNNCYKLLYISPGKGDVV